MLDSIAAAAETAGVLIVTGDTKVIERRSDQPGMMINTTGIGRLRDDCDLGAGRISIGDAILINGPVAEHGIAVMSAREGLEFETEVRSDAACLNTLVGALLDSGADVKFLRDPTRGGLAGVLADLVADTGLGLEIDEDSVSVTPAVRGACEMLGLDPLEVANEGKVVAVVSSASADAALDAVRNNPLGDRAAIIGRFVDTAPPIAELITRSGGRRVVSRPHGEQLPRIC
jgi:hydrogenase expression/formation protein HypE